jgi:hypothetical protein
MTTNIVAGADRSGHVFSRPASAFSAAVDGIDPAPAASIGSVAATRRSWSKPRAARVDFA